MRRRNFAFGLGALFLTTFHLAQAQQPRKIARIGYLSPGDPVSRTYRTEAFRQGLKELGYIEGKNIIIEYRFAEARPERLPELARELVRLKVDIIFAGGGPATEAAKNATQTIPIVTSSQDPVSSRFVAGLSRPAGNITGLTNLTSELVGKRLELLKEVIPRLSRVAVLWTPCWECLPGNTQAIRPQSGEGPRLPLNPWACNSRPQRVTRARRFRARIRSYRKRTC